MLLLFVLVPCFIHISLLHLGRKEDYVDTFTRNTTFLRNSISGTSRTGCFSSHSTAWDRVQLPGRGTGMMFKTSIRRFTSFTSLHYEDAAWNCLEGGTTALFRERKVAGRLCISTRDIIRTISSFHCQSQYRHREIYSWYLRCLAHFLIQEQENFIGLKSEFLPESEFR